MAKITLELPENWQSVTIGQYAQMLQIKETDNIKYLKELLLIFCDNLTEEIINKFNSDYLGVIAEKLQWMSIPPDLENIQKSFKIDNDEYFYERDFNKFTFGEMISYETLAEKQEEIETFLITLAIILRKKNEEFNSDLIKERIILFRNKLMIGDIYGLVFFFKNGGKRPILILEDYLKELKIIQTQLKSELKQKQNQDLIKDGNGLG